MSHTNPNFMTGTITLNNLTASSGEHLETTGAVESAEIVTNQNNNILLKLTIHDLDEEMLFFSSVVDSNVDENSGYITVTVQTVQDLTTFFIQIKNHNVSSNADITLSCFFAKNYLQ